jgi:hypothetical protein
VTDEPDDLQADPDAEAVRRLLADARHTGPMPADVVDRMDAVLTDLAASPPESGEPAEAPADTVVVSLTAQRRRRAVGLLVAAAAVVVGGVVLAQHPFGSDSQSTASAGSRAADSSELGNTGGHRVNPKSTTGADRLELRADAATIRHGRLLVRPRHFTADALAARRVLAKKAPLPAYSSLSRSGSSCVGSGVRGELVRATYQQSRATLVFHAPGSGSQVVDLYLCGSNRPVRSATLPSP